MSGRQAARIAAGLAAEVEASLLRAGCVPPPREDLTGALYPVARILARSQKAARHAEAFHRAALESAGAAEAACLDAMAFVAGSWAREHPPPAPAEPEPSRLVKFDPANWTTALRPPPPAPAREAV